MNYNLTHLGFKTFKMGRVNPIACIPTLPGDVFNIDMQININMAPFRRQLYLEPQIKFATFWIPHRHLESNWIQFIEEGTDTSVTLSTSTMNSYDVEFMPHWVSAANVPNKPFWYADGFLKIYDRFWRPKMSVTPSTADTSWTSTLWTAGWDEDSLKYGPPAANLMNAMWTQTPDKQLSTSDVDLDVSGATLDIRDIAERVAKARSENRRNWYNLWYEQIIQDFGGSSTIDAEPRPELLWTDTVHLSGEDIYGHDTFTLGGLVGRPNGTLRHRIPNRYIPEHGTIWTVMCARFPNISTEETHWLIRDGASDYDTIAGDSAIVANKQPVMMQLDDIFDTASTDEIALLPHSHWYRQHPSYSEETFQEQYGFTFTKGVPSATDLGKNFYDTEFDNNNFQSTQFAHGLMSIKNNCFVERNLPTAEESIMAGMKGDR